MRLKSFAVMFLCVLTLFSGLMLAGCGDKYAGLAIEVDKTEISLKIGGDSPVEGEEDSLSADGLIKATLVGASADMTRGMSFRFEDPSIVTPSLVNTNGDTNTIKLTASTAGTTQMYIISNEKGSVISEPITVKVYRDAETMSFDSSKKPSVKLGESLSLNSSDLIKFAVGGEPVKIYPNEATFTLMSPDDARWESAYGSQIPVGVSITDNVLSVSSDARCGIIQLVASMGELNTVVYVMAYKDINPDEVISLYQNDEEVTDVIKSIINPIEADGNKMRLVPQISDDTQNYQFRVSSRDKDILLVGEPNASNQINAIVCNSGKTKVDVMADLVDPVTGTVYRTFTRTYDVQINRIVTSIKVYSSDVDPTDSPAHMTVQDVYVGGLPGKKVHFNVQPDNDEHGGAIINTDVVLSVTQIDGIDVDLTQIDQFGDVVIYVNDNPYVWGTPIKNDSDIFVSLGKTTQITNSFRLTFSANTFDPSLPVASNYIDFDVEVGVTRIEASIANAVLGVGMTTDFDITYFDNKSNAMTGSPKFSFNQNEFYSITDNGDYKYTITALKEGDTQIVITAESGARAEIELNIRVILTAMGITLPSDRSIVSVTNADPESDTLIENNGVQAFTITVNSSIDIGYKLNPTSISSKSFSITAVTTTDPNNDCISVAKSFVDGKLRLNALGVTPTGGNVVLSITFSHYVENNGIVMRTESVREVFVSVYKPISYMYWENTDNLQNITKNVLNSNHLNYIDKSKGTISLVIRYDPTSSYFVDGGEITWASDDETKVRLTPTENTGEILVTAILSETDTAQYYTVTITAYVLDFAMTHLLSCVLTIENPIKVSGINLLSYYDDYYGIRLNDIGASNRTTAEILPEVIPGNAYNKKLKYVILNEAKTEEVAAADAIITIDPDNQNIIRAVAGKSGRCYLRLYPEDALLTEDATYKDVTLYKDIYIVVENGDDDAYTIYEPAEFIAIGNSDVAMTKNYILMNSIDLSGFSTNLFPLGDGTPFSGTIRTAFDSTKGTYSRFSISGLPVVKNAVSIDNNSYLGVFSQVISDSSLGAFSNIDFYFQNGSIDLSAVGSLGSSVYAGLLAGKIIGNLSNTFVGYTNYRFNSVNITNMPETVQNFYFGAVAGELSGGAVSDVYANISINLVEISATTQLIVGGVFGRFAGTSFGQDTSLVCNVNITTTLSNIDAGRLMDKVSTVLAGNMALEGIGGLVGIADKATQNTYDTSGQITGQTEVAGVIRSMQVSGSISAPTTANVGGLVGLNNITLGSEDSGILYKNLASVRVLGGANVGGFVGANYGKINCGIAEMYDTVSSTDANSLIWVKGMYRVGGFAGYNDASSLITYSYAMSYVNRTMQTFGDEIADETQFYGDIIGVIQTGGFVGYTAGTIINSFAYDQIQQINYDSSIVNAMPKYTGGFAGLFESETGTHIDYSFAIGAILTSNPASDNVYGEYVGFYKSSTANMIHQVYASVDITAAGEKVYNFMGSGVGETALSECFYMDNSDTDMSANGGYTYEQMKLNSSQIIYNIVGKANWGFTDINSDGQKQEWVKWDDSMSGVNRDLPILFDKNGKMLYSQIVNEIKATPRDYTAEGNNLPTFFGYANPDTAENLGSVVLLDNIALDSNGKRSIMLSDLLNISVAPENLDPAEWKISIESSDFRIVEVIQPNQSLIGASLVFKDCGVVTLTLRSLLNINVVCTVEINVVGGFNEFELKDSQGRDITASDYIMYIKAGSEFGYSIHSNFIQSQDREYITAKGLVYSTQNTENVRFANVNFEGFQAFIGSNTATILSGVIPSEDNILFGVAPYIELQFGGKTYRKVFDALSKSFVAKVYQGITSVDVYTGVEANMPSGSDVLVSVDIVTDNVATVALQDFVLRKDGNVVLPEQIARYAELISTDTIKIATNNNYTCYLDGAQIIDKYQIARIITSLINGENLNAYIVIDGVKYSSAEDIIARQSYLITDCVRYTYKLSLKDADRVITQNTVFDLSYTVIDTECGDSFTVSDSITFTPASINRMDLSHYTYGANSMEAGEAAGNSISPGTNGVLRIDLNPYYAHFDYVIIASTARDNTSPLLMQQLVYTRGVYRYLTTRAEYDSAGNLILRKVTGIDADGNEYFDGRIYVSTLITAGVAEGSRYSITAAPMRTGVSSPVFEPKTINLTATFAPFATLTLDSEYSNNIVARGTVANLRLTGTLLNSRLTLSATYYGTEGDSRLTNCAFDERNIKYTYATGQKEAVDMVIPFYVGLLAKPDNGKIIVSVTINSWTSLGGQLNPLIVTCTLNIVDYIVDSTYTRGTQTGNFEISVNSYTPLIALLSVKDATLADFALYIGYSADDSVADAEKDEFATQLAALNTARQNKIKLLNSLGNGDGGIWWFDDGTGFAQINTIRTYLDFLVIFDETAGQDCYKIRGRDLKTDFLLRLSFETTYIYNNARGCYEFSLLDEVNSQNANNVLDDYVRKLEQDFYSDLTEQSDEDNPYAIDSADAFRTSMVEGGNYMLTADIELFNWRPISTAISSLDGNGHIIYLRSFAQSTDTTSANYGLFSTLAEGAVVKNLIIDVSHNIYVDLQNIANVKFGFVAGVNNGIIYNCDIVVTKTKQEWSQIYNNTAIRNSENADEQFGRNIFDKIMNNSAEYIGYNTNASTFIMTSKTVGSNNVSASVGALVGENGSTGTITNSRVGRVDGDNALGTTATTSVGGAVYAAQGLNFFASGNVGGLVGVNSGVISNSYFANGYVVNSLMDIYSSTNTSGARTGGLVAVQNSGGRIFSSYARGQLDDGDTRSTLGGVIAYGTIGGLVHSNSGVITNSYSNMNLSSASGMGGFVYENLSGARITHSYSLSKVKTQGLINGMFIGVDNEGNLLDSSNSVVENCFYLTEEGAIVDSAERAIPLAQESWQDPTGSSFEGFAISIEDDGENTWFIDSNRAYLGPQLYLAEQVFVSSRTTVGENANYARGSKINPLLITSLDTWKNRVFNYRDSTHKSSYLKELNLNSTKEPNYEYVDAYIMLLNDLDFESAIDNITSKMRFSGHFYGNGHIISGINFTQSVTDLTAPNDFGLFAELKDATVSNLTLILEQALTSRASHVGVLAGTISDSMIENIAITSSVANGRVTGTNMVGALAGHVSGYSYVYNVMSNLSISANAATIENHAYTYFNSANPYSASISYAGGVIGVLDLDKSEDDDNTISPRIRNLYVQNTIYTANTPRNVNIDISGEIVGGVLGLIGTNSEVYKAYFDVKQESNSSLIRGRNFTGGLVGENRGAILNSRISLALDDQIESDSQIMATDSPSSYIGVDNLFSSEGNSNAVGGIVGLNVGGMIKYSYNRVAVINTRARVAGGIIGLAINAPKSYDTSTNTDPILGYLQNINTNKDNLLAPVPNSVKYRVSSGTILPETGKLTASALLQEVYTTAMVNGGSVIGGLVGAQINAPVYTYSSTQVVAANAYDESNNAFVARIKDASQIQYIGSASGYLGLNYVVAPSANNIVAYVRDLDSGVASQNLRVTSQIAGNAISPIGNAAGALGDTVTATSFISAATSSEDKPFENFDSDVWNLDNDKLEHRFPYHKIGYDSPVKDIATVDEFFTELVKTRASSHYRIIKDLTITGARWQQFTEETGLNSLGTDTAAVRGRLEGAVSIISGGKYTTRAANITLTNFTDNQMKLYHSLFGYTNSFKMSNLNFIYEFDNNVRAVNQDLNEFALLMLSTNATTLNNIGVTLATQIDEDNVEKHTLKFDNLGESSTIQNLAIVAARSYNSVFNNVRFDAKVSAANFVASTPEFTMGALVGQANGTLTIGGVDQGWVEVSYNSPNNYQAYVGALVGRANGVVNLSGAVNKTGNIRGIVNVETTGYQPSFVGGVVGLANSTINLKNFTSNVAINLTRHNSDPNNSSIDYVGGITATINRSNISGACVLGDITVRGGNGVLYLGGVAGTYTNSHNFASNYSGFTTQNSSCYSKISITGDSPYSQIYVGGIYGLTTEQITMQNGLAEPQGESKNIYYALYSSADINVDTQASYIYAGGVIGKAQQGIMQVDSEDETQFTYTPFTKPNVMLRVTSCGFIGDLIVNNDQMTDGTTYLGGMVGESELLVQDAYSNGAISYQTQGQAPVYLGGIVGLANNHIFGAVSLSVINISREYGEDTNSFVDPITTVAESLSSQDKKTQIRVDNVYCSPELNGVYPSVGSVMTAWEAFSTVTGDLIKANLNNWFYHEVEYGEGEDAITLAVIIPAALSGMVDYTIGGEIAPALISDYSQIIDLMADNTYRHRTVFLERDVVVSPAYMAKDLTNIRKIVGNTHSFVIENYGGYLNSDNFGLFKSVPNNALISSLGIKFDTITLMVNANANVGVLAGTNYGTIFNVSIGALPSIDTGYMGTVAAQKKTVATFSNDVHNRYLSSVIDSQEIATLLVRFTTGNGSVGGMFGSSQGLITNSFVSIDISISGNSSSYLSVGGLVGQAQSATIDNVMTNGRLNLSVNSAVGGVLGRASDTIAQGIVSNVNMGIFVPDDSVTSAGFAFGTFTGGEYKGVIVNTNISATNTDYFADNTLYSEGFTTAEMSSQVAIDYIAPHDEKGVPIPTDNGFRTEIWAQDDTLYYGYPVLNTITNIDFGTGDGTSDNPYQFAETAQLLDLVTAKGDISYCLTRDMVVSPQNYAEISKIALQITELNGMGHTIVIYELPDLADSADSNGEISLGLFREIKLGSLVRNMGVAIVDSIDYSANAKINFGGLAVRNYGNISNCYVVCNDADNKYHSGTMKFAQSKVNSYIGGLVSQNYGEIASSWSDVNFEGNEGHFGGLIGLQGRGEVENPDGTTTQVKQASVVESFSSGSIYLNGRAVANRKVDSGTSAGGLIGKNVSFLQNGYVIRDCYVYAARLGAKNANLNIGSLVGYVDSRNSLGEIVLNTYRTYSFVATDTTPDRESKPTGNYLDLGMVGNQTEVNNKDTSSSFAVAYYQVGKQSPYASDYSMRTNSNSTDVGNLTIAGSSVTIGLRGYVIGQNIYTGWAINSIWKRNLFGAGYNGSMLYLDGVTPTDRQEVGSSIKPNDELFEVV